MRLNHLNRRLHESEYTVRPKIKGELVEIIKATTSEEGDKCDLNFIDVSRIKDMSDLFGDRYGLDFFNGDISEWDTSNVRNMRGMFVNSRFNGDISNWDVSKVEDMSGMFSYSRFNGDISKWDVSNVEDMSGMFRISDFNRDISKWDVSSVEDMSWMFSKSNFNRDISKWDVSNVINMYRMFTDSKFNQDISDWDISNVKDTKYMFTGTKIKDEYKPQLKTNESNHLNRFSNRTSRRSLTESRNRIPSHLRRFI